MENGDYKRSVDFLDVLTTDDPAESKLLDVLEANNASLASSRARPARAHRRKPSKLQQMVKQLSTRKSINHKGDEQNNRQNNNESHLSNGPSHPYSSISNSENINDCISPVEQEIRSNSMNSDSVGESLRSGSSGRGSTVPAQDLPAPTSEFLSHLSDRLDFKSILEDKAAPSPRNTPRGRHRRIRTKTEALYDPQAQHLERVFQSEEATFEDLAFMHQKQNENSDFLPRAFSDLSEEEHGNRNSDVEGGSGVTTPLLTRQSQQQGRPRFRWAKRAYAYLLAIVSLLGPRDIWEGIKDFLWFRVLFLVAPLLTTSLLFFYCCGNPNFHLLPGDVTLSWWLIFAVRLLLTFSLAEATQYFLDIIATRTSLIVRVAGPYMALVAMESLGWPFLLISWATWSSLLMRGGHPFTKNWLWFLHIDIFSTEHNPDGEILESYTYAHILMAMLMVGTATTVKRTACVLYLGQRMLQHYRKQLRELLVDIKMVMEVAQLAAATETREFSRLIGVETVFQNSVRSGDMSLSVAGDVPMTTLKATASKIMNEKVPTFPTSTKTGDLLSNASSEEDDDDDDSLLGDFRTPAMDAPTPTSTFTKCSYPQRQQSNVSSMSPLSPRGSNITHAPERWDGLENQANIRRTSAKERAMSSIEMMRTTGGEVKKSHRSAASSNQGLEKLVNLVPLMERWEEPETKSKKLSPSLFDVLHFRKAMEFMNTSYPFSETFGVTTTRKECIRASARVYRRLLRYTPGESMLKAEVIEALAYNDDGHLDIGRLTSLKKVFHENKDKLLTQLSFLQSIDNVYKQLRFLNASILNSSKIDSVLNDGFDVVFNGILAILVMTLLGLNPWPLLVSFSTVMVSFAFSFGPSCAKYIEGTLMIFLRRPYDIGDRITIIAGESLLQPSSSADTYLVEDISLSTTTLRYARTNEVSTVNNAAIANSRIVNGARSMNAIVTIEIDFEFQTTQEQIEHFRIGVENFLIDRPEVWVGLVHFRNDFVDHNVGCCRYLLRVKHKKSWQDMPPIMVHKGELQRYANKVAVDLGIAWLSRHRIQVVEVPPIRHAQDNEDHGKEEVEPFMKFMKQTVESSITPGSSRDVPSMHFVAK